MYAQKTAITGKVIDAKTKEPLIGVVVVADDKNGITTDINGNYLFEISAGEHKISFKFIGYAAFALGIEAESPQRGTSEDLERKA